MLLMSSAGGQARALAPMRRPTRVNRSGLAGAASEAMGSKCRLAGRHGQSA